MSEQFELTAQARTSFGKAETRRLRRLENLVPAVVYGAHKEPTHVSLLSNKVNKALENEGFYSQIIDLTIDGKKQKVILKALQRHPYKPRIMHMDFLRIKADEKLTVKIPVHFIGEDEAPGLKQGGVMTHHINDLEVSCLPADIPTSIDIDVSKMEMDAVIHLSEIKAPKGVELLALTAVTDDAHDHAAVSVHMPKVQAEPVEDELSAQGEEGATDEEQQSDESGEESSSE